MTLVKTKVLAEALGVSVKTLLEKARKGGWAYVENGRGLSFVETRLPTDVRFAVAAYRQNGVVPVKANAGLPAVIDETSLTGDAFINANDRAQGTAQYRAALIFQFQESKVDINTFLEGYNELKLYPALYQKLGDISRPTFYRWLKNWKESGASGITPKYGTNRGGAGESLLEEEKDLLRHFWLKDTQPSAMHAWRLMKENIPYSKCSYQTALRYLNSIPLPTAGFYRQGEGRFENLFLPHMEQRIDEYRSLDVVVSDHHCLDCVVMYKGQLVRPWITTFQDLRSGKVLGWCPSVKPSSLSITVAFYMACITYGIPQCLLFDNGQDYRSKWLNGHTEKVRILTPEGIDAEKEVEFQGMYQILGCKVRFTRTYNGKSKARQERYFRIIGEYLAKEMGTYVGSDSRSRPEEAQLMYRAINGKAQRYDIPLFEDFVQSAEAMINYINDRLPATGVGMDGKTRSQVFAENLPPAEQIRHPNLELLQKALMKGEVRVVNRQGITINKVNFWHNSLFEFFGRKVRVYSSLTNPQEITCHTLDGEFICKAQANYFKETGRLNDDIGRLTDQRQKLTQIAIEGSGEVTADPAYATMIDVARGMYESNQLESVTAYLDVDNDKEDRMAKAAGAENESIKKGSKLKSIFGGDIDNNEYVQEA